MRQVILGVLTLVLAAGAALADEEAARKTLEGKGLVLQGNTALLPIEADLSKHQATLNRVKRDFRKAETDYRAMERRLSQVKAYISDRQYRLEELKGETRKAQTVESYNKLVEEINALERELQQVTAEREKRERDNQTSYDKAQAEYVTTLLKIAEEIEAAAKKYDELNQDEEVRKALEAMSVENRRFIIGPTNAFESARRMLARETADIESGVIKLQRENDTFLIDVRINEKPTRQMVLDTGASSISLPFTMAQELGITVEDADPKVNVVLADGRQVMAALKTLESVQVGQFIVRNVECLVLPEELIAAPALLGNSFLKHFQFRLDPEAGELRMTRLNPEDEKPAARPAAGARQR